MFRLGLQSWERTVRKGGAKEATCHNRTVGKSGLPGEFFVREVGPVSPFVSCADSTGVALQVGLLTLVTCIGFLEFVKVLGSRALV